MQQLRYSIKAVETYTKPPKTGRAEPQEESLGKGSGGHDSTGQSPKERQLASWHSFLRLLECGIPRLMGIGWDHQKFKKRHPMFLNKKHAGKLWPWSQITSRNPCLFLFSAAGHFSNLRRCLRNGAERETGGFWATLRRWSSCQLLTLLGR